MPLPPLIPRSVLFGNPDRMSPSLSPDGSRLGFVAPEDGVLNIWVGPADGSRPAAAVTHDRDRGIRDYLFVDKYEASNRTQVSADAAKANADSSLVNNVIFQAGVSFWIPPSFEYTTFR